MISRLTSLWPAERVLSSANGLLVVDKPYGVPVQGGGDEEEDVTSRLEQWLDGRGFGQYLGVHQRLDAPVSGVMAFTRDRAQNLALSRDFEGRRVQKTYLAAVTLRRPLASSGSLRHRLQSKKGEPTRIVNAGGQEAALHYRMTERVGDRALLELHPETGRTHQLRVQLAAVGAPIAGDTLYGGAPAFRLLLHSAALELPSLELSFAAPAPSVFRAWVRGDPLALGDADEVRRKLSDALCRRYAITATAYRLVNDAADGLPGVAADRYDDWVVLNVSTPEAEARRWELAECFLDLGARGVYVKVRERKGSAQKQLADLAPPEPLLGEAAPEHLVVEEGALKFRVRLGEGLSTGLFVDQRRQRARVFGSARGARVLNLFAYTCSFSVAAALGGAGEVTSVDLSRRALERGQENFVENGIEVSGHRFVKEDVQGFLRRAVSRGERFDLVIFDPPSFSQSKTKLFRASDGYAVLLADALRLLAPRGTLLAVTNHRRTSRSNLRQTLHAACRSAARTPRRIKDLPSAVDCPDLPEGPSPSISLLLELDD